ncbi:LLM class flavin-dependent oxidoreductase [Nocardia otitidiscaviarum]|uniref:LLM class flavin-dependent oxidoreductase n=1 Tax=Nocardia otitidiscaviarum TaxID=1823 RepID=A0A516NMG7_9NOCA|nr:LLM class flavin-dependent oxidoreductase [Nocardia otitidiscaviarum]MCP9624654.1 LLM class flavin-dependent oxidoreductase [Nocardia otitidiscaviarum]QDP80089.1 LLM class flavin-dependent oxidoreductase [Nocardia otitidiscaviarum]
MTQQHRTLRLGACIDGPGGHIASWRHPQTPADAQLDFAFHRRNAQTLERAVFDCIFVADVVALWGTDVEHLSRTARNEHLEPLALLSAYAATTEHIGLVATATTTYNEPYDLARKFASLDHLSGGRAGWNVVTSAAPWESRNFGFPEHMEHDLRYTRADEFVSVANRLWTSGAVPIEHSGRFLSVRGPLNVAPPPQGRPVIFQAGASPVGRAFAARHGEVLFTRHTQLSDAQEFYADMKSRAAANGRAPDTIQIWPGLQPIVAGTEAEAKDRLRQLQELMPDIVALRALQAQLGDIDLTEYPLDGPVPDLPVTNNSRSTAQRWIDLARRENLTLRQLSLRTAGDIVAGTPEQLADHMETMFTQGAADGFLVDFPCLPSSLDDFVEHVVPELRRRGLLRTSYVDGTLRDNLGLAESALAGVR